MVSRCIKPPWRRSNWEPDPCRHTAVSLAISGGANPKAVQTMLGHQSGALTLDTYADLSPMILSLCQRLSIKLARPLYKLLRTNCGLGPNKVPSRGSQKSL
jgi:integrase